MEVETWRPLKDRFSFGHLRGFLTENHQGELVPDVGEPVDQEGGEDAPDVTHGGADEDPEVPETRATVFPSAYHRAVVISHPQP